MFEELIKKINSFASKYSFIENGNKFTYLDLLTRIAEYQKEFENKISEGGKVVYLISEFSLDGTSALLSLLRLKNIVVPISKYSQESINYYSNVVPPDLVVNLSDLNHPIYTNYEQKSHNALIQDLFNSRTPGLVLFSSGSTGTPKGMVYDFNKILLKFSNKIKRPYVSVPFLLFDHFGGLNTILGILTSGGTAVVVKDRNPETICASIENNCVELLPATPSFINQIIVGGFLKKYNLSTLKLVTYGTEPMPLTVLARIAKELPHVRLLQTYGLSEVGVLPTVSKENGSLWIKIKEDGFKIKIVDNILHIKSDFSMKGYINAPDPFDSEGYFNTNDCVEVDGDYIRVLGRSSDIINVGGLKVYPAEIEDFIITLQHVKDVVIYSEKNSLIGNIVVAKIYCDYGIDLSKLRTSIRQSCLNNFENYKVPQKLLFVHEPIVSVRLKKQRRH